MSLLSTVFAADTSVSIGAGSSFGTLGNLSLGNLISFALNAVLIVAAILFVFMLIIGGIKWITSGGDKAGTEGARNQVTAALIGLVIVFSAWIIINFVAGIFGINLTNFDFGNIQTAGT